jgi:Tetratricopeptide repeat
LIPRSTALPFSDKVRNVNVNTFGANILLVGAGILSAFQWVQIVYRSILFFTVYHGEHWVNHIGNGDFMLIYAINTVLLCMALYCWRVFRQNAPARRRTVVFIGTANLVGCLVLLIMHADGVLVEHGEFIRHMREASHHAIQVLDPFDEQGRSPAAQRYDYARHLMETGAFEQAAKLLHQAAVETPHFKTYELLGECYMQLKRLTEAIPYLAAATTLNRGVRAPSLLAQAWLALGRHTEALEAANMTLSRDPKNKAALRVQETAAPIVERQRIEALGHDEA